MSRQQQGPPSPRRDGGARGERGRQGRERTGRARRAASVAAGVATVARAGCVAVVAWGQQVLLARQAPHEGAREGQAGLGDAVGGVQLHEGRVAACC
jgi:hypothetical protein